MSAVATATRPENLIESEGCAEAGDGWRQVDIAEDRAQLAQQIEQAPDNGQWPLALGQLEMGAGNFAAARKAFTSAVMLLPKSAAAHSNLALSCQKLGRSNEAALSAIRAISLDPTDMTGLKVLARIHLDAGQHEAAQRTCRLILRRDGQDAEARQMMEEALVQEAKLAENLVEKPQTVEKYIALDSGLSLKMGEHSYIHGGRIRNPSEALTHITIGKFCSIATDLTIIGYDHHSEWITTYPFLDDTCRSRWPGTGGIPYPQAREFGSNKNRGDITIGHEVWIGYNAKLFKGVRIGNGAVIGACSLVNKSVEPYTIVAGTPARPLRKRFSDVEIAILERLQWWDWPEAKINKYMRWLCSARVAELDRVVAEEGE